MIFSILNELIIPLGFSEREDDMGSMGFFRSNNGSETACTFNFRTIYKTLT